MTFRELRDALDALKPVQLDAPALYFDGNVGELFEVVSLSDNPSDDYGHENNNQPVLKIEQ